MGVEDEALVFYWRDKVDRPLELEVHKKRREGIAMQDYCVIISIIMMKATNGHVLLSPL